ncbi:MAG: beta-propeller fold lactonase family protein, partial [Methylocapsa sp.]|nr:beta-propeller fold lactonase family protein [Methylocapsa sp.]
DGEIGTYALQSDGSLKSEKRIKAETSVRPMAVSPDKRFLIAAVNSRPCQAFSFIIDPGSGALRLAGKCPLAGSTYISLDRSGRFLFAVSYSDGLIGVNPAGADGRAGEPLQVIPTARNPHSIRIDNSNRFVFVPHLGTDQVFQFLFDQWSGRLAANTPPVLQLKQGTGPRHLVISQDNRFVYVLNELTGTVTTLALDSGTGLLSELESISILPSDSKLVPGMPRGAGGTVGANQVPRNIDNDIWAADLHLTPNGCFLYASERTTSTIGAFRVDGVTGKLSYLGSTPTEKQPRGFNIDPAGRFIVASGEKSDMLAVYAIEAESGALKAIGRYPGGNGANWVEIVTFD